MRRRSWLRHHRSPPLHLLRHCHRVRQGGAVVVVVVVVLVEQVAVVLVERVAVVLVEERVVVVRRLLE